MKTVNEVEDPKDKRSLLPECDFSKMADNLTNIFKPKENEEKSLIFEGIAKENQFQEKKLLIRDSADPFRYQNLTKETVGYTTDRLDLRYGLEAK